MNFEPSKINTSLHHKLFQFNSLTLKNDYHTSIHGLLIKLQKLYNKGKRTNYLHISQLHAYALRVVHNEVKNNIRWRLNDNIFTYL